MVLGQCPQYIKIKFRLMEFFTNIKNKIKIKINPANNYLFTVKNIFFRHMAQCILICLAPGVTRDKIHFGVNTLSKLYKI